MKRLYQRRLFNCGNHKNRHITPGPKSTVALFVSSKTSLKDPTSFDCTAWMWAISEMLKSKLNTLKLNAFFCIFKTKKPLQLWEQEMYSPFTYNQITKNFHHFPANVSFFFLFKNKLCIVLKIQKYVGPKRA